MPEPAPSTAQKNPGSFARLLASFTGMDEEGNDDWDLSELPDDVATISYEEALRAYRPARTSAFATEGLPEAAPALIPTAATANRMPGDKKRKTTSTTLRLTEGEQAQLHQRAAAAKLSVSAYIRSCIFEAESLRTQVKEALAQMQSLASSPNASDEKAPRNWRMRFLPRWSRRNTAES